MNWINAILTFIEELFGGTKQAPVNDPIETMPTPPQPIPPQPTVNLVPQFCSAIQDMEGWYPGSTSQKNNNPGNIRCLGVKDTWAVLAVGSDNGFCVFPSEVVGMEQLVNNITAVCKGKSVTYNAAAKTFGVANSGELTIEQFFLIRDPASDGNQPIPVAERIAKAVNLPITAQMKVLLG